MKLKNIGIANLIAIVSCTIALNLNAQDGASLYKPCAACHSIGGGRMIGPDLKGITKLRTNEWLVDFIKSSSKMIKAGDPIAVALFEEYNKVPMPDNNLTTEQINKILEFIDGGAPVVDKAKEALQFRLDSMLKTNSAYDIDKGKELFDGSIRFVNGGPSCISCHNVVYNKESFGGMLAKDLTKSFTRLNGFAGLKGIIATPPFPSMAEAYNKKALTDEEITYLQLYLKAADLQNPTEPLVSKTWFLHAALTIGAIMVAGISLLWYKRKRKSVNHNILKRQKRYSI